MQFSDGLAAIAILISCFTFYWTALRERFAFHLIRVDGISAQNPICFALLNGGSKALLVSSVLVSFENENRDGWYSPHMIKLQGDENGFSLDPGESKIFSYIVDDKVKDQLLENGNPKFNEKRKTYEFPVIINVEWFDHKAKQHSSIARIMTITFHENGGLTGTPLQKNHELYKHAS